jgi:hypothetical protein
MRMGTTNPSPRGGDCNDHGFAFHGLREAHGLCSTRGYSPAPLRGEESFLRDWSGRCFLRFPALPDRATQHAPRTLERRGNQRHDREGVLCMCSHKPPGFGGTLPDGRVSEMHSCRSLFRPYRAPFGGDPVYPGRRCAAIAASLCPGLTCSGPFGANTAAARPGQVPSRQLTALPGGAA